MERGNRQTRAGKNKGAWPARKKPFTSDFHSSKRTTDEPEVRLGGLVLEACTLR